MDDDDCMIEAGKFKNELKSDVNSKLKSDPIIDIDFSNAKQCSAMFNQVLRRDSQKTILLKS